MAADLTEENVVEKERNYAEESARAQNKRVMRLVELRQARDADTLGDDFFKMAQALILCSLPYSPESERQISRRMRLSDGQYLTVTFTAMVPGVGLPYGADRQLVSWMFDRALRRNSAFIPWRSAAEYLRDIGKGVAGKNVTDLRDRVERVIGLGLTFTRGKDQGKLIPIADCWNLPASITRTASVGGHRADSAEQVTLLTNVEHSATTYEGEMADQYGLMLSPQLWREIKAHHVVLPRQLWLSTRGSWRLQDATLWLYYRCYQAQSETTVPWRSLAEQFPPDKSNSWRLKSLFEDAVKELLVVWPQANVCITEHGLLVGKADELFLPDNPTLKRVRRLQ